MNPTVFRAAHAVLPSLLWLALIAVALTTRPPLPVDETRYLAVAWEMWLRGDFLVPHLNGEPYSHKPPLLFWLMQAGWAVFGVVDWWPRLVAPLFGLASLWLTVAVGRLLWPDDDAVRRMAPLALIGFGFWALFSTLTMFDMMLALFALAGLWGVLKVWRTGALIGWLTLGVAIGGGVLAKGPAILLHVLPVALFAPLWGPRLVGQSRDAPAGGWRQWYWGMAGALVLGAAIGLAWAIPAALAGGETFRNAIFWGQTAGRMVESFAHERPFWWYAATTPGLMIPLLLWPRVWRSFGRWRRQEGDGGLWFCLCWTLPAFATFSLISGKQLHYLLPEYPALALAIARLVANPPAASDRRRLDLLVPGLTVAGLAVTVFLYETLPLGLRLPDWSEDLVPAWALLPAAAGIAMALWRPTDPANAFAALAGLSVSLVVAVHLMARPALAYAFDLQPIAERLGFWEREGRPIAHYGKYHGQFQFLGRLHRPIAVIGDQEVRAWVRANPEGLVVSYHLALPDRASPVFAQSFRRYEIGVWDAATVLADPDLVRRPD